MDPLPPMLTPAELAGMLHVNSKTVTRWANEGRIDFVRTPGGHRRFPLAAVLALLDRMGFSEQAAKSAIRNGS